MPGRRGSHEEGPILRRCSKKPRKAPIYWLLQSPRRHYAIWQYYPRLDHDLLYKALQM